MPNPVSFAKNVRILVDAIPERCQVLDRDAGLPIQNVIGFKVEARVDEGPTKVEIHLEPGRWWIDGDAKYILDEATLQRLAKDNGFKLVKVGGSAPVEG